MIARMCFPTVDKITSRGRQTQRVYADFLRTVVVCLLAIGIFSPPALDAEQHVVSSEELRGRIASAYETRELQVRGVQRFLSSKAVERDLTAVGLDPVKIERLVPLLDNDELARLAERTRNIERDLAAGALNNQQLTYIVIALATAIVVILAT